MNEVSHFLAFAAPIFAVITVLLAVMIRLESSLVDTDTDEESRP